ncbi:hypothetical protein [Rathayibacter soli]|uniref:hypothetical protein n=1 Tax=Rathayibacter soli TaxID=3144168 RepID=UPI0027E3D31A|nr:hypothetical protein [Glaciibacter superstes]
MANIAVLAVAAGMIATVALPAYAFNPTTHDQSQFGSSVIDGMKQSQSQTVQASATTGDTVISRDPVTATSEADLQAQKAAAEAAREAAAKAAQFSAYTTTRTGLVAASGTALQLAQTLMAAYQAGRLTDYQPAMIVDEIGAMASGSYSAQCEVDTRLLQILVLTLNHFGSLDISDLGRPCVGEGLNCSVSAHCTVPIRAVDFTGIGGQTVNGSNSATIQLLRYLDEIVPPGSNAGQSECRASAGTSIALSSMAQFSDNCSHQHLDIPA